MNKQKRYDGKKTNATISCTFNALYLLIIRRIHGNIVKCKFVLNVVWIHRPDKKNGLDAYCYIFYPT